MKALVGAFNQEKALVGAFSVIVQPVVEPMDWFAALGKNKDPGNTVKTLVAALSLPGWFDVKLRVIKLLEENCVPD